LNQLVAGSIIVRHIISIFEPSLPLRVYGPIRSTHNTCHLALMGGARNNQREFVFVNVDNTSSLPDLTSDNDALTRTTSALSSSAPTNPKPKRKQIRPTASAVQQRRVSNLAAKKQKSESEQSFPISLGLNHKGGCCKPSDQPRDAARRESARTWMKRV